MDARISLSSSFSINLIYFDSYDSNIQIQHIYIIENIMIKLIRKYNLFTEDDKMIFFKKKTIFKSYI